MPQVKTNRLISKFLLHFPFVYNVNQCLFATSAAKMGEE